MYNSLYNFCLKLVYDNHEIKNLSLIPNHKVNYATLKILNICFVCKYDFL